MSNFLLERVPKRADLTSDQVDAFRDTGYLHLPGLLAEEVAALDLAFEDLGPPDDWLVVHCPLVDASRTGYQHAPRVLVPDVVGMASFAWLGHDPRLRAIVGALGGEGASLIDSNASVFRCDTLWHSDSLFTQGQGGHVLLLAYLDPLDGDHGALRVVPGTHRAGPLRDAVRQELSTHPGPHRQLLGPRPDLVPAEVVATEPGDVIALDLDVVHASFGGGDRRRAVSLIHAPFDSPMR